MIILDGDHHEHAKTLRVRLAEAEETLGAIQQGEIDALVVEGADGSQVYTLHSAEEPYRDLVEQMQEGALVLTGGGDILYANARFAALVGEPLESVVGSHFARFVSPSHKADFEIHLQAGCGRCRSRLIGPRAVAVDVSVSVTTTPTTKDRRVNLIVTDLSELLEANSHRDRAERDNRTKDEFLAMLAHELRTPLGAISTAVRVLKSTGVVGDSAIRMRDVISRQVERITHLVDDLLDVERVVSGKLRLRRQPLDMAEAIRRAVGAVTGHARLRRDIDISTEPVWIDGDALRIDQVLTNVLTNAVKYTPEGGQIRVTLRAVGGDAVVTVEDTGVGISPALLPFVFDPYVQASRTLHRARGGLGIGLTLVRRLVEMHGGTVSASSDGEARGSQFTIRLGQIPAPAPLPGLPRPRERRAEPRRVLLIEESEGARAMLRTMLELAGHAVYDAADGVRGLELLNVVCPDVGIIDVGLPLMDGYQVARRIREQPLGRGMLLVAVSGYRASGDSKRSLEHGFDYHLVTPVDPDHLARLIGEAGERSTFGAPV